MIETVLYYFAWVYALVVIPGTGYQIYLVMTMSERERRMTTVTPKMPVLFGAALAVIYIIVYASKHWS